MNFVACCPPHPSPLLCVQSPSQQHQPLQDACWDEDEATAGSGYVLIAMTHCCCIFFVNHKNVDRKDIYYERMFSPYACGGLVDHAPSSPPQKKSDSKQHMLTSTSQEVSCRPGSSLSLRPPLALRAPFWTSATHCSSKTTFAAPEIVFLFSILRLDTEIQTGPHTLTRPPPAEMAKNWPPTKLKRSSSHGLILWRWDIKNVNCLVIAAVWDCD